VNYPVFNTELNLPAYTTEFWWEVDQWCNDNIGPWNVSWYKLGIDPAAEIVADVKARSTYLFKNEHDRLLFILRWS
jgi:hypothetical protein